MKLGTKGYDELAERRAAEIEEVLANIAQFVRPMPAKVGVMFEHLLLSYAMLRSRDGQRCTVLLSQSAYDKAKDTGLLAWCSEHYPIVTFEAPFKGVRGCHATQVIYDEVAEP